MGKLGGCRSDGGSETTSLPFHPVDCPISRPRELFRASFACTHWRQSIGAIITNCYRGMGGTLMVSLQIFFLHGRTALIFPKSQSARPKLACPSDWSPAFRSPKPRTSHA